jgi:hypothetical protein
MDCAMDNGFSAASLLGSELGGIYRVRIKKIANRMPDSPVELRMAAKKRWICWLNPPFFGGFAG